MCSLKPIAELIFLFFPACCFPFEEAIHSALNGVRASIATDCPGPMSKDTSDHERRSPSWGRSDSMFVAWTMVIGVCQVLAFIEVTAMLSGGAVR